MLARLEKDDQSLNSCNFKQAYGRQENLSWLWPWVCIYVLTLVVINLPGCRLAPPIKAASLCRTDDMVGEIIPSSVHCVCIEVKPEWDFVTAHQTASNCPQLLCLCATMLDWTPFRPISCTIRHLVTWAPLNHEAHKRPLETAMLLVLVFAGTIREPFQKRRKGAFEIPRRHECRVVAGSCMGRMEWNVAFLKRRPEGINFCTVPNQSPKAKTLQCF